MAPKVKDNWQAQDDAYTLARYEEIMNDSSRRANAIKAAKSQAKELTARANAMTRAASNSPKKTVSKKK